MPQLGPFTLLLWLLLAGTAVSISGALSFTPLPPQHPSPMHRPCSCHFPW